jgi:hypothetical protein
MNASVGEHWERFVEATVKGHLTFFRYEKDRFEIFKVLEGHCDIAADFRNNDSNP